MFTSELQKSTSTQSIKKVSADDGHLSYSQGWWIFPCIFCSWWQTCFEGLISWCLKLFTWSNHRSGRTGFHAKQSEKKTKIPLFCCDKFQKQSMAFPKKNELWNSFVLSAVDSDLSISIILLHHAHSVSTTWWHSDLRPFSRLQCTSIKSLVFSIKRCLTNVGQTRELSRNRVHKHEDL